MDQVISKPDAESKQFAINVSTNVAVMVLNILIGIWYTPYIINKLGIAAYGVVALATSLTSYMFLFGSAIDNTIGRYLTIDIKNKQFHAANRTFNTAFWTAVAITFLILPLIGLTSFFAPQVFDIPAGDEQSSRWLFLGVMGSYLLVVLRSVFSASPFSFNRLDLNNIVIASNNLSRVLLIVLFFGLVTIPGPHLIGIATLISGAISLSLAIVYWHRLTPEIHIQRNQFEWAKLKSMFGMSSWLVINQIGSLLFLSIDLIIVNRYLGVDAQGRYASALQWAVLLRTFSIAVATAVTPIALDRHVRQDQRQLAKMAHSTVKWLGLALALPVGLLIGFAVPLLHTWLGPEFEDISLLLIVLVGHLSFNLAVRPLFSIQVALNKVKWPAIVSVILGVLNLFLAVWWVNWGMYGLGVAVASGIVLTLRNALFVPLYGARIQSLPWYTFYRSILPGMFGAILAALMSYFVTIIFNVESWIQLIIAGMCVALPYIVVSALIFMNKEERRILQQYWHKKRI